MSDRIAEWPSRFLPSWLASRKSGRQPTRCCRVLRRTRRSSSALCLRVPETATPSHIWKNSPSILIGKSPRKAFAACAHSGRGSRKTRAKLLRFLLLLLPDADLELLLLRFLVSLPVVPLAGVGKILVHVDILGQHGHQRRAHRSVRTGDAVPFYVRNRHYEFQVNIEPHDQHPGGTQGRA